jgi:hypothetical protein
MGFQHRKVMLTTRQQGIKEKLEAVYTAAAIYATQSVFMNLGDEKYHIHSHRTQRMPAHTSS